MLSWCSNTMISRAALKGWISGLGLAIVKQIMALHDGSLRITNTAGGLCAELIFSTT